MPLWFTEAAKEFTHLFLTSLNLIPILPTPTPSFGNFVLSTELLTVSVAI